jgi:hypothetical protein
LGYIAGAAIHRTVARMKRRTIALGTLLASGALALLSTDAVAGYTTPPNPTLTVSTTVNNFFLRSETASFSGADYCGPAVHMFGGPVASIECGHTVFIGIWQPGPSAGGAWSQSVTVQSTPGGFHVVASSVGQISGSFVVPCGSGNGELYAYDLDEGTLVTGASVNAEACLIILGGGL